MYRVLVAEDEDIIRRGMVCSVPWAELGCTIPLEVRNGQEGIEMIRQYNPDIVITDINMPVVDGLEMICETYENYDYAAIILSVYSSFEYAQQAIRYGVLGYLLKPLSVAELKEAVVRAQKECDVRRSYLKQQKSDDEWRQMNLLKNFPFDTEDEVVRQMISYVERNYQKKIVMREVVEELNYSETFLNKKFKEIMGTTFILFLNRYRIQKSLECLQNGESVQNAACKCGIGDYKYFGVVFKKFIGCSPKKYLGLLQSKSK